MKAIISSTYSDKYLFFLPITIWCWNKLGVECIIFLPKSRTSEQFLLVDRTIRQEFLMHYYPYFFECPEHKEATYAQCSRLYVASLELLEDEILIVSDVDMANFKIPPFEANVFTIFGSDLVPPHQVPMCYISAQVKEWRTHFNKGRDLKKCLDDLLGHIECESFVGNYWGKDQETAYSSLNYASVNFIPRARSGTQFASNRLDRDDAYLLDRLSPDIIDYHMPRPGYENAAFEQILTVLKYFYPNDNFQWLIDYRLTYLNLL